MTEPAPDPPSPLDCALAYAAHGWPVIPLRGKLPLTPNGSNDASTHPDVVRDWWKRHPSANIGLATGIRFWALDIDTKSNGDDSLETLELRHGRLPDTLTQITGTRGRHFLFQLPRDFTVRNSQSAIAEGIDTRGTGGYIVASPSVHPDTRRAYIWDGLDEWHAQPIAHAPEWLLALLRDKQRTTAPSVIPDKIQKGRQHATLVSVGGSMRARGLEYEEILAALLSINANRCEEPGPVSNIEQIARSICKYPAGKLPTETLNTITRETEPPPIEWGDVAEAQETVSLSVRDLPSVFEVASAETPYLIPLYLPESSILILSGESGHGKSTVASLMAGAVADGGWFAGQAAQPRDVLILDRDNPAHVVSERLTRIGVTSPRIRVWGQWYGDGAPDPSSAPILEYVRGTEPRPLIIIDSLLDFLTGDENDSRVVREMFGRLRILTGAGATVILIHHTGKAETASDYRGSSAIKGSCDAAFKISDLSPTYGKLTRIQLKAWKMRVRIQPHVILDWDDAEQTYLWRPPKGAESNTDVIRELLLLTPGASAEQLTTTGMERGLTRSAIRMVIENGISGGWITTEPGTGRAHRTLKHYLCDPS